MEKSDCGRSELLRGLLKSELLLDGAMGSLLITKTKGGGGFIPESCNITCPETVREIHKAYLEAGSRVICANSFGANPVKYPNEWQKYLSSGLKLAKDACADFEKATGRLCFAALDAGPTGRIIGDYFSFEDAYECYAAVARSGGDADCFFIETMMDLNELRAALLAFREHGGGKPILTGMTFQSSGYSIFGASVKNYAECACKSGADAVGINCSLGPDELKDCAQMLAANSSKPTFIKPNAGLPKLICGQTVYALGPKAFADGMKVLRGAGIRILGGCCGTTPEHITELRQMLESGGFKDPSAV